MKQRPIIFNTEMVRAIIDGRKTQTRRPAKNISFSENGGFVAEVGGKTWMHGLGVDHKSTMQNILKSKYGPNVFKGDQLYVRETWRKFNSSDECGCSESPCSCPSNGTVLFKASHDDGESKWKPSIHMPRWAARIIIEVTDVRVERLSDISEQNAKAEGINSVTFRDECLGLCEGFTHQKDDGKCQLARSAKRAFLNLWDSIYSNSDDNPWVWVIKFKVISTKGGEA